MVDIQRIPEKPHDRNIKEALCFLFVAKDKCSKCCSQFMLTEKKLDIKLYTCACKCGCVCLEGEIEGHFNFLPSELFVFLKEAHNTDIFRKIL